MGLISSMKDKITGASGGRGLSEARVLDALTSIMDPDLHQNIVALGFVQNVQIKGDAVSLEVNLTTPACPVKEQLKTDCEAALRALPGVAEVTVTMTATTRAAKPGTGPANPALAQVRNVIAVASGKGGVGKSTTAVNLAFALARAGSRVGLLDADIYGPSIPKMVRIVKPSPEGGGAVVVPPEAEYGVKVLSIGMFADANRANIMRGPMAGGVIKQFLTQVAWGELDYLVIDYPPGTGDVQLTISQTAAVTGAVIVTTPQEVALIDVRKAVHMFKTLKVPILGVIETMSYFVCDGCDKRHYIFRQGGGERLARELGVAFLGGVPLDPRVAVGGDEGRAQVVALPESPVAKAYALAAGATAQQLSILNAQSDGAMSQFSLVWQN